MSTRLEHVLRVGAQHAAHRTAPTAGFDDDRPIPREAMDRALKLLNPVDLYKYMKHGLRWWKENGATVSDAELYKLFQQLPKETVKEAQILMDLDLSEELSPDFGVATLLHRLWEGRYDERGARIRTDGGAAEVINHGGAAEVAHLFEILLGHPTPARWIDRFEELEEPERSEVIVILRRQVERNVPLPRLAAEAARASVQEAYDDLGPNALQNL